MSGVQQSDSAVIFFAQLSLCAWSCAGNTKMHKAQALMGCYHVYLCSRRQGIMESGLPAPTLQTGLRVGPASCRRLNSHDARLWNETVSVLPLAHCLNLCQWLPCLRLSFFLWKMRTHIHWKRVAVIKQSNMCKTEFSIWCSGSSW